jgi:hypothetical protein
MTPEINNILTLIECTLINDERPEYIEVSYQNGAIYVLLSKKEYEHYGLYERIQGVYGLINFEHSDILGEHHLIVECFTPDELTELFKLYGDRK